MKHINKWLMAAYGKLTGNGHKIPLMIVTLDIHKFRKDPKGSCTLTHNPIFHNDEEIKRMSFELCDYIRNNYDMEDLIK